MHYSGPMHAYVRRAGARTCLCMRAPDFSSFLIRSLAIGGPLPDYWGADPYVSTDPCIHIIAVSYIYPYSRYLLQRVSVGPHSTLQRKDRCAVEHVHQETVAFCWRWPWSHILARTSTSKIIHGLSQRLNPGISKTDVHVCSLKSLVGTSQTVLVFSVFLLVPASLDELNSFLFHVWVCLTHGIIVYCDAQLCIIPKW